jgi:hypothetical protein
VLCLKICVCVCVCVCVWQYLAELFLESEMFPIKFVEKIKTHALYIQSHFLSLEKTWRWRDNLENYDWARQATDENMRWCMPFECRITKATDTRWEYTYVMLNAFPWQKMVSLTLLRVTLYVDCLPYLITRFVKITN